MNTNETTSTKFNACLHTSMSKIGLFILYTNKKLEDFDFNEFNKLLIKYDLEEYTDLLFQYFINIIELNQLNTRADQTPFDKEQIEFRLDLLKTLQFLLSHDMDETISVSIKKNLIYHIENEQLIFEIERYLEQLFRTKFQNQEYTLKNIKSLIPVYEQLINKNAGAPVKIQHLTILASEIGDLIRVDKYVKDKNIEDIDKVKLVASDRRFIYHCLDFWGFIEPRQQNTSTPEKYIYTTIDQGDKYFPPNYFAIRKNRMSELKEKLASIS